MMRKILTAIVLCVAIFGATVVAGSIVSGQTAQACQIYDC